MSLTCQQSQPPKPFGNGKTTLEKGGRDPPDVSLDYIVNDLLSYFNEFDKLRDAKQEAEEKYNIEKEHDGCWPVDDIKRAWGKTQRMEKESSKRRHWALVIMLQVIERQSDELESEDMDYFGATRTKFRHSWHIRGVRQSRTERQYLVCNQATGNDPSVPSGHNWENVALQSENMSRDETIYIRIPLTEMVHNEQALRVDEGPPVGSSYKLIDGSPSRTDLKKRKSYTMSFNSDTNNAEWVYEILNKDTLVNNCMQQGLFEDPYNRGHLAAAANHKWCREARNDANLSSNIAPQHKNLNSGPWEILESSCRNLTEKPRIRNVHVYSGPLYLRDIHPPMSEKTVPSDFFKVIIVENDNGTVENLECYLMPNHPITDTDLPYRNLRPTVLGFIQYIEQESGLTFIEHQPNARERIITARLQGEDLNGIAKSANIEARICYNNDQ